MGIVFLAEDPQLQRLVALKAMRPALASNAAARQRFLREARAAAAIEHDHIISIYQVAEESGVPYLAMPFLKGESLDAWLNRDGSLPVPEALRIGREIAEGLDAAHQHGLIHRDIKPANIWLESRGQQSEVRGQKSEVGGRVKILDFGMARTVDSKTHLTQTGAILGTPSYMAPEQARGLRVDARCDLFSLGCMLYRMTTATLPFTGTDPLSVLMSVTTDEPEPPRNLNPAMPAALSDLIIRLLAKDPKDRPASAQAVVEAIEAIERKPASAAIPVAKLVGQSGTPVAPNDQVSGPRRRYGLLAAIGAGVLFLVLAVAGIMLFRRTADKGATAIQPEPGLLPNAKPAEDAKQITNSIGMKLVLIPAGKFMMGSPASEKNRAPNEEQHEVAITKPFYLGMYTVTQAEYKKVMGKNPSYFSATGGGKGQIQGKDTSQFPVETVSWEDAVEFCRKLSELPGEMAAGRKYRLPTEAEWEYSCRAGTTTRFYSGDSDESLAGVANFAGSEGGRMPTPVDQFNPNAFGLYDMHGNVWQWCADWYEKDYYKKSPGQDPQGPGAGAERVLRGGSNLYDASGCRSAHRYWFRPSGRIDSFGFRVVLVR